MVEDIRFKVLGKAGQRLANKFHETGGACPYCGSYEIEEEDDEYPDAGVQHFIGHCGDCNRAWKAHYWLVGIVTDEMEKQGLDLLDEITE